MATEDGWDMDDAMVEIAGLNEFLRARDARIARLLDLLLRGRDLMPADTDRRKQWVRDASEEIGSIIPSPKAETTTPTPPRYTQQVATDAETSRLVASMAEDPRGEWVRYGDVLAMMERSRKRIEENEHG